MFIYLIIKLVTIYRCRHRLPQLAVSLPIKVTKRPIMLCMF